MSRPDFERMRDEMLRNGVSARVVTRTVAELNEHFSDLETEALQGGMTASDASAFAACQLGDPQTLVAQVSRRSELRSWMYRYPSLARVILPVAWIVLLPAAPVFAGVAHFTSIVRWSACLLLSALVTAAMMLIMQLSLTLT
jgi:hypothetical protein